MDLLVPHQGRLSVEGLWTLGTREGFDTCVLQLMLLQVSLFRKAMSALLTLEGLLTSMHAFVVNQLSWCTKLLWTVLTVVGFVAKVHLFMRY